MRGLAAITCAALLLLAGAADAGHSTFKRHTLPGYGISLSLPGTWKSPMKFLAFDPIPLHGFATNANVVVTPLPHNVPFEDYSQAIVNELRTLPTSGLRQVRLVLPGGPVVRLTYRLTLKGPNGPYTLATTQYAFPRATRSVVVTYTTLPEAAARYSATFATSARSVRFET